MAHVTPASTLVSLHQLSFHFDDGATLFDSLNLTFDTTPTAIVGRNGAGKSVLARLIAGELTPSAGKVDRFGSIAYVKQNTVAQEGETIAQTAGLDAPLDALARLAAGTTHPDDLEVVGDRWDLATRFQIALQQANLPELQAHDSADNLSGGQRARVALVGALLSGADLLVLDEPTNHLDRDGRAWLRAQLNEWRGGLIVVSHDRQVLGEVERIVELTPHGPRVYGGNYAVFHAQRDAEQQAAHAALEHARTERARERRRSHGNTTRFSAAQRAHGTMPIRPTSHVWNARR